jgi:hypothetical protein
MPYGLGQKWLRFGGGSGAGRPVRGAGLISEGWPTRLAELAQEGGWGLRWAFPGE